MLDTEPPHTPAAPPQELTAETIPGIDQDTALLVCAGPSLDRLAAHTWRALGRAGAIVSVNGSLAANACLQHDVRFTHATAMDIAEGLAKKIPGFDVLWANTPAWRVTTAFAELDEAESHLIEVEYWSDEANEGFVGGSTAMVVANWLCNPWPDDPASRAAVQAIADQRGKPVPRRGFRKLAYIGLDMQPRQGGHARGAGAHQSGFSETPARDSEVRRGWMWLYKSARARGIEVVNLTPDSGLEEVPRQPLEERWLVAR